MKKVYLFALSSAIATLSFGQQAPQLPVGKRVAVPMPTRALVGDEFVLPATVHPSESSGAVETDNSRDVNITRQIIGITDYDLQSNAAVHNRFINIDGEIAAGWTMALSSDFADRGTGYNENNGAGWGSEPYNRLENVRTGWPSLLRTGSGRTVAISHEQVTGPLHIVYREDGSSTWVDGNLPQPGSPGQLWNRAAVGGADNNSIHVICVSTPVANGGAEYLGQDGALMYFRSQDGGDTWDIQEQVFPELDQTHFLGFSGDTYSIAARGNTVAFAVFNDFADSFVMISEDNGETWSYRTLVDFPVDLYVTDTGLPETGEDFDEDGIFAEFFNTDGAGQVLIDLDGKVHVVYGEMYYTDTDLADGNFQYFPGTNGLSYWNEDMEDDTQMTIAYAYDIDGSGTWDLTDDIALYFVSGSGMPSVSIDGDGVIYVSYSAIMESHAGSQNYRHIYVVRSEDGGLTWNTETACNLTPDLDFDFFECVFGTMPMDITDELHVVYQRDFEPGLSVRGDEDAPATNDIVHMTLPTADLANCDNGDEVIYEDVIGVEEILEVYGFAAFPNPAKDVITISLKEKGAANVRLFDMAGKLVLNQTIQTTGAQLQVNAFEPGVYLIQVEQNGGVQAQRLTIE
ncbi:MAG: hypothetical protein RL226_1722 [Bacteroidota bacterium]